MYIPQSDETMNPEAIAAEMDTMDRAQMHIRTNRLRDDAESAMARQAARAEVAMMAVKYGVEPGALALAADEVGDLEKAAKKLAKDQVLWAELEPKRRKK